MENRGYGRNAILVGSVAKGTYLKNPDIDIFLRFPSSLDKKELKSLGIEIGKTIIPDGFAKYAEHPYWRGKYKGFDVDIVPCYFIGSPEDRISAVDRTPFHTEYVLKHLGEEQRDDVRLLKAFLKGIGAYGAEARIQGFSGYLTELLILKYKNFIRTLKAVSEWRSRVYLHLNNGGRRFTAPVVFIDPVDSNRNAASAVSEEKKALFIHAAKSYLKNPTLQFFFPKKIVPLNREEISRKINERGTKFFVITMPRPNIIDDNLYPQIQRSMETFLKILKEFHPLSKFFIVNDKIFFIIELEKDKLPTVKIREGPPVWDENSENFLKRWHDKALRGPYIRNYRWYADIKRDSRTVSEVLLSNLKNYKLGKSFEETKGEIEIKRIEECLRFLDPVILTEFFNFRFPWER